MYKFRGPVDPGTTATSIVSIMERDHPHSERKVRVTPGGLVEGRDIPDLTGREELGVEFDKARDEGRWTSEVICNHEDLPIKFVRKRAVVKTQLDLDDYERQQTLAEFGDELVEEELPYE